ncbi:MAG: aspartate aminotransferase family protein [Candidatus Auribacterota bacterium]|nr:aspartate aminotransferase family protein [Candidatus Auribacterota bacterium]
MSKTEDYIKEYDQYVLGTYTRNPIVVERGEGSRVWDAEGKQYLDFFPGWGVSSLGHCHPAVVKAIKDQANRLLHMPNNFYNEWQGLLARKIIEQSFPGKVFFGNSGAEANEGALKLARRFGEPEGRFEIITMKASFHGRSLATVTATGQKKYHSGFGPLIPGFKYVPFNDLAGLKEAITDRTTAIMLELVQGEGGVHPAEPEYARAVRDICDEKNILMIVDEVQTGMGRTGEYFVFRQYGIEPDIITLAKALGGGLPIGAFVVKDEFAGYLPPGTHASTFGGGSLVCAASLAVFQVMEEENILDNVARMGDYLREQLLRLKAEFPIIKEVRGIGLMLGMELDRECKPVVDRCLDQGLIINCTAGNVLRVMPACNIKKVEIDQAICIIRTVLNLGNK